MFPRAKIMKVPERGSRFWPVSLCVVTFLIGSTVAYSVSSNFYGSDRARNGVMLILRGIANESHPRGQLDDQAALEYARRLGYRGEVLDIAGNDSQQITKTLDRIKGDREVTAIYGFSGGGYNTRKIWTRLGKQEKERIRKIVVLGAPGVSEGDFPDAREVIVKQDPPAGHLAGPKALLEELERS
jgi:hypothetical protein